MTTQELKQYIDKVLGNNLRCLLPSYWWKKAFGAVIDKVDEKLDAANIKTINGESVIGEGNLKVGITSVSSMEELNILEVEAGDVATVVSREYGKINPYDCYYLTFANYDNIVIDNWDKFKRITHIDAVQPEESIGKASTILLHACAPWTQDACQITYWFSELKIYVGNDSSSVQYSLEELNNLLKESDYRLVAISEEAESREVFDKYVSLYSPDNVVSDLYVKGDSWERLAKEGDLESVGASITVDSELSDTSENPVQNKVITAALNNKVDKVNGKQLSTEDFTSALKAKLEGLNNYDDTSIQNAVNSLTTQINTLVSGDASAAIESFNEIIAFLNGVEDSESLDSIIAAIEQQIAAKQDKLVSGTNIKTINGESILGEGDIVVNVDTSNLATKEELVNLTNEIIANEEVHAGAYNDLNTRLNELSENVQGETVTKEEFNAAIEGVNNGISAKQDVLVSGTNIKTINNESILGSGNIEINVDTSSLASKEELQNLQNEVIVNEEVVAAAFNDVNERINAISENVSGTTVTKEELESAVETINQTISDNKSATDTAIEGLETSIGNVDAKFANYATTESLTTEITNLTNEIIANEEVHAAALNDLNERLNNAGGGSSGGSGVVIFYIPSGETATDEEIAKNKAAYEAYVASYTNPPMVRLGYLDFPTFIPAAMFSYDIESNRVAVGIIHQADVIRQTVYAIESDGSVTML